MLGKKFGSIAALVGLVATLTLAGPATSSYARDYPSWDDVAAVRNDQAAAQNAVTNIQNLIATLKAEAEAATAFAEVKGTEWREADQAFQDAAARTENLRAQADTAATAAQTSAQQAGQMAAQLVRGGSQDIVAILLTSGDDSGDLLYALGISGKVSSQANDIYERAAQDRNTADALADQADIAEAERDLLRIAAEAAFAEAQVAAAAAATAVLEETENLARLEQQLKVLNEKRAATEADYQAGVAERIRLDAAAGVSSSGWAKPAAGSLTSGFGYRTSPTAGASSYHRGVDIGAGCYSNIYAASAGTVVYAGWNGGYGNFILIDHGGGLTTAYAHIVSGGILAGYGQQVGPGQHIAEVGTTGTSTGCHLHFEVRINGTATNPVPFLRDRGIGLG